MSLRTKFLKFVRLIPLALLPGLMIVPAVGAQNLPLTRSQSGSSNAWLGITMEDVTADNMSDYRLTSEKGVIVHAVQDNSPAANAALKQGDVIVEFASQPVWSSYQLVRLVRETPPGRKVTLGVSRAGKKINLTATLTTRTPGYGGMSDNGMFLPPTEALPELEATPDSPRRGRLFNTQPERGQERTQSRPRLGVELQPLTEQMADFLGVTEKKGALVAAVQSGSPSDGKLRAGDVIVGFNDSAVQSPADLTRLLRETNAGTITLKIIRNRNPLAVAIDLPAPGKPKSYRL